MIVGFRAYQGSNPYVGAAMPSSVHTLMSATMSSGRVGFLIIGAVGGVVERPSAE